MLEMIYQRRSPIHFDSNREVSTLAVVAMFEGARWSPSWENAQPAKFAYVSKKTNPKLWNIIVNSIIKIERGWASTAPAFIVATTRKDLLGKPNPFARYDLGQAVAYMTVQAYNYDVFFHQVARFDTQVIKGYFKADLNLPFRLLMLPAKLVAAFSVLPGRYSLNGKYGMLQRSVSSLAASIGVALFFEFLGFKDGNNDFVRYSSYFIGLAFSWFVSVTMNRVESGRKPGFFFIHSTWTFIMSILWMFKCSQWLMKALERTSTVSSIKMVPFLLAAVNGIGDLATNASLVKQGKFSIVGTSIFSSVIMNSLLVLPICMISIGLSEDSKTLKMQAEPFISICALAVLLVVFLVVLPLGKGRVSRLFGAVLIGIWIVSVGCNQMYQWMKSQS